MTRQSPRSASRAVVGVVERGATAVLVTLGSGGTLLDRRQLQLVTPGLSTHPHHHEGSWAVGRYLATPGARPMSLADAVALVERVRQTAEALAAEGLDALASSVPERIGRLALRLCPELPAGIDARIRDHRAQTVADSVMYRHSLATAARARGWAVHWYDRARVAKAAAAVRPDLDLDAHLKAMGRLVGAPWQAEHRLAAAAALAALAD